MSIASPFFARRVSRPLRRRRSRVVHLVRGYARIQKKGEKGAPYMHRHHHHPVPAQVRFPIGLRLPTYIHTCIQSSLSPLWQGKKRHSRRRGARPPGCTRLAHVRGLLEITSPPLRLSVSPLSPNKARWARSWVGGDYSPNLVSHICLFFLFLPTRHWPFISSKLDKSPLPRPLGGQGCCQVGISVAPRRHKCVSGIYSCSLCHALLPVFDLAPISPMFHHASLPATRSWSPHRRLTGNCSSTYLDR